MATKYHLFVGDTKVDDATRSKKQAVIAIGEATGQSFYIRTDAGAVVYEHEVESTGIPTENPVNEPTEPLPDEVVDEAAEPVFYESVDFGGNYSIVTAPGALEIAAAAGIPARSTNVPNRLNRIVEFGGPDMDRAKAVKDLVLETEKQARADLKEWQHKHAERRRGLTDMQRYVEHRDQIAKTFRKVAIRVKKEGL